jgi:RhoGEF domain
MSIELDNRFGLRADYRHPKRPRSTPELAFSATAPTAPITAATAYSSAKTQSRLMFTDYLIKPVQRICKYHLLLDQLKVKKSAPYVRQRGTSASYEVGSHIDTLITRASDSMRLVVDSVNDDRRRHEYHFKSLLIASRMAPYSPLSSEFLRSLGACLLAGALDVVYHRPPTLVPMKAKYLGVFLYAVGYLVLTKVVKGRLYDPSYWFPLDGFEVINQEIDDRRLIIIVLMHR